MMFWPAFPPREGRKRRPEPSGFHPGSAVVDVTHPVHPEISLLAGEFYAGDPHPYWAWMREHAPVYYDERWDVWALTRHADIRAAERDPVTFSNARGIRPHTYPLPMMISMDDPDHLKRRKLVNRGFTPR